MTLTVELLATFGGFFLALLGAIFGFWKLIVGRIDKLQESEAKSFEKYQAASEARWASVERKMEVIDNRVRDFELNVVGNYMTAKDINHSLNDLKDRVTKALSEHQNRCLAYKSGDKLSGSK